MSEPSAHLKTSKRYELVAAALRSNIASGRLQPGLVLLEGPIANLMKTSRAPVQAALRILEDENLICRFNGRGYLVGGAGTPVTPLRRDIGKLGLRIPNEIDTALQNRGLWERVYEEVESAVAACLIFGEFRIIESELGDYYGVSRTVVRDVLGRLHERGLITKTQSSHWIVGALTAQSVRERFQLRQLLEPEALRLASERIDLETIGRVLQQERTRNPATHGGADWMQLDRVLMESCIFQAPNGHLLDLIRQNQMPLAAASRALTKLGLPEDEIAVTEYLMLFELIAARALDAAATYWRNHLAALAEKNLARLKIVAVITGAPIGVPYLTPLD
ncbi:MAG: GntR family transcriptional regulator [Xanthobacteraceae bacterium]|jgi:DNA-binding GntR family transcriptional regulator